MSGTKDWSAQQYLKFEDERNRPCFELISRIPLENPETVVDIGCGPGNSTELLLQRWPNAKINGNLIIVNNKSISLGFDNSPDMVEKAQRRLTNVDFKLIDASTWLPSEPVDLLFSNAVFHWLSDHVEVIKKLFNKALKPGGVVAIQMPDNIQEPSHKLMQEVADSSPW